MKSIGQLAKDRSEIILKGFDPISAAGYTQVPNTILRDKKLSTGAKIAYAVLLSYAWQDDHCFKGQVKMAEDMGASPRSVVTYLKELERVGYVEKVRRGLNKTNVYYLYVSVKKGRVVKHSR